jgi:hypothetical protein
MPAQVDADSPVVQSEEIRVAIGGGTRPDAPPKLVGPHR